MFKSYFDCYGLLTVEMSGKKKWEYVTIRCVVFQCAKFVYRFPT